MSYFFYSRKCEHSKLLSAVIKTDPRYFFEKGMRGCGSKDKEKRPSC